MELVLGQTEWKLGVKTICSYQLCSYPSKVEIWAKNQNLNSAQSGFNSGK